MCSVYLLQIICLSPLPYSPQLFISDPGLMTDCEADNTWRYICHMMYYRVPRYLLKSKYSAKCTEKVTRPWPRSQSLRSLSGPGDSGDGGASRDPSRNSRGWGHILEGVFHFTVSELVVDVVNRAIIGWREETRPEKIIKKLFVCLYTVLYFWKC